MLTAHPTEARRRTTIEKLARVFAMLRDARRAPAASDRATRGAGWPPTVQELWGSDELRAVSPTVLDEVRAGLVYFVIDARRPRCPRSTATSRPRSPRRTRTRTSRCPPLLTFGSWIGGDRDGNPNVTPEVTGRGARRSCATPCLRFLEARVGAARRRASSLSSGSPATPAGSTRCCASGARALPRARRASWRELQPRGALPARVHAHARARARDAQAACPAATRRPPSCSPTCATVERALRERRRRADRRRATCATCIRQVEVFGFHFARLDIREHAEPPPRRARRDPRPRSACTRATRRCPTTERVRRCCAR